MSTIAIASQPVLGQSPRELMHHMRAGPLQLSALPPLSLYVHIPWCVKKCPYCDFNSHAVIKKMGSENTGSLTVPHVDEVTQRRYVTALIADLESCLPLIWGRTVSSIFIGGGTPSLFSPAVIDTLLSDIRARLRLNAGCEITLEANPGTFERGRFADYRRAGVTRLSLGVQSFNDNMLEKIGRIHNAEQARQAALEVRQAFETFNLDLMYGLPGQTLQNLRDDMEAALEMGAPHLSLYHLSIEPNTYFAKYPPAELDNEEQADLACDMLDALIQTTAAAGFERYEVSAYARAGHTCAHNLNYWRFGDYLGIGAGAHGKLSFAHRIIRQVRLRDPVHYMDGALSGRALASEDDVKLRDIPFEYMLGALRVKNGFSLEHYMQSTGLSLNSVKKPLEQAVKMGLVQWENAALGGGYVQPTQRGFDFLSDLQALFLPEKS